MQEAVTGMFIPGKDRFSVLQNYPPCFAPEFASLLHSSQHAMISGMASKTGTKCLCKISVRSW